MEAFRPYRLVRSCIPAVLLVLFLAVPVLVLPGRVGAADHELPVRPPGMEQIAMREAPHPAGTERVRSVTMNRALTGVGSMVEGDRFTLNLFDDVRLEARVDRVAVNKRGSLAVRASIEETEFSHTLIVTTGSRTSVLVDLPEQNRLYRVICGDPSEKCRLFDVNRKQRDHLAPRALHVVRKKSAPDERADGQPAAAPLADPLAAAAPTMLNAGGSAGDPAVIDVMIAYTQKARQWADENGGGIDNVLATAMGTAQLVADNSGAGVTFRLVHAVEVPYLESANGNDSETDLERLTNPADGYMDDIHVLRDIHGADLVSLFTEAYDVGGLGWLLEEAEGDPDYAFSLVRVQQAATSYTLAHEMGHNMGLHHHKNQREQPGPGLYSYSAGWRWTGTDNGKYCSVMTYESGEYFDDNIPHVQVPHFSNPVVLYQATPTGDAVDGDNARTMKEVKHVIASYRTGELPQRGDLNRDDIVDLADLVIALQVLAAIDPVTVDPSAGVSGGGIGLADAIYILQQLAAW